MTGTSIFLYFAFLVVCIYFLMIIRWSFSWLLYSTSKNDQKNKLPKISVVVAVRNEAETISNLLELLQSQVYPNGEIEIIISDDFSEDSTRELVRKFIASASIVHPIKLLESVHGSLKGKKAALTRAIESATGSIILTTDADCFMGNHWVKSFGDCFGDPLVAMVTGFVRLKTGSRVFENLQALEFLSLSGSGAATVILGKPLMCNGANLAFTRESFLASGGYQYGNSVPTGDDTFLMLSLIQKGKGKVIFNKQQDGIVTSIPTSSMDQLMSQRSRWASKVSQYKERYISITGLFLISVNLMLIAAIPVWILQAMELKQVFLLWFLKACADFALLLQVSRFAKQQNLLLLFLPATIIYPFYALAGIIISMFNKSYTWKGRTYNAVN